jgi:hypothetical protein
VGAPIHLQGDDPRRLIELREQIRGAIVQLEALRCKLFLL